MKNLVYLCLFALIAGGVATLESNLPLAVFLLTLAVGCFFIARYIDNHEDESKKQSPPPSYSSPRSSSSPPSRPTNQKPPKELQYLAYSLALERINKFYDLGLFDGDIYEIATSPSPWDKLEEYVTPGAPSFDESFNSLERTAHNLAYGIGLDDGAAEWLENEMLEFIDEMSRTGDYNEIFSLYSLNEDGCTPETQYLVGKINYFFIMLAFLESYAEEKNDDYLKRKCREIFEKNRSIF